MAFKFDNVVPNANKSKGVNKCQFIILHHTAGNNYQRNLDRLSGKTNDPDPKKRVSAHFLIGPKGEVAKIGEPSDICWHAGESEWGNLKGMNAYSIGIEIVDDIKQIGKKERFTDAQRSKVRSLVNHLIDAYNIPEENILKHADLTRAGSKKKQLRDGVSKTRKVDVDRQLRVGEGFQTFAEYRHSFYTPSKTC